MLQQCEYCESSHIYEYCHKGIQLVKYMKNKSYLQKLSMFELQWLITYFSKSHEFSFDNLFDETNDDKEKKEKKEKKDTCELDSDICQYIKKRSNIKKNMMDQLVSLDISRRMEECPICYEELSIDTIIITPCLHAFCDRCIFTHIQYYDECPCCRSFCPYTHFLLVIPKKRIISIYKDIYAKKDNTDEIRQIQYIEDIIDIEDLEESDISRENIQWNRFIFVYQSVLIFFMSILMFMYYMILVIRKRR